METVTYKNYVAIALSYGAVVGALYLFGFWGTLNVNILEFIGLGDLIKLAVYPLLVSMASLLSGYLLAMVTPGDSLPPGGGADTPIGRFGLKYWRYLVTGHLLVIFAIILFVEVPGKWFLVAVLASLLSVVLTHLDFFIDLFPNARARGNVLTLAILVAGSAFYYGTYNASLAKSGKGELLVDAARSQLSLNHDTKKPVVYLGYVTGHFVLLESMSGAVVFVKMKDDAPMFLVPSAPHK